MARAQLSDVFPHRMPTTGKIQIQRASASEITSSLHISAQEKKRASRALFAVTAAKEPKVLRGRQNPSSKAANKS